MFKFNSEQTIDTAMGTRPAPSYANIFEVARIDNKIVKLNENIIFYIENRKHLTYKFSNPSRKHKVVV